MDQFLWLALAASYADPHRLSGKAALPKRLGGRYDSEVFSKFSMAY